MRFCRKTKFTLGFRERDVEADLALFRTFQQELEGNRGLACTGASFDEIKVAAGETANEHIIKTRHAQPGLFRFCSQRHSARPENFNPCKTRSQDFGSRQ